MDHTSTGAAPVKTGKADRRADLPFLVITLTLLGVGVVMVLSASFASAYYDLQGETGHNPVYFFSRQAIFAAAGVCVMLIASRIPMRVYRACALPLLLVSVASLAAVLVIGTVVNGARRWISLGFTTFQPSEITKIAIILYFSALICKYKDRMRTFRYGIAPFAAILAVVSALLVLEPHFSATIIILAIGASMLFLGGVRLHWFIGAAGALLVGAVAAVLFVPYVAARVASFRDPFSDLTGDGWQIVQSLYAIGSGGLSGLGIGDGGGGLQVAALHEYVAVRIEELQLCWRTNQVQHSCWVGHIRNLHADAGLTQLAAGYPFSVRRLAMMLMVESSSVPKSYPSARISSLMDASYSTYTPPLRSRPRAMDCGQLSTSEVGSQGSSLYSPRLSSHVPLRPR